MNYDKRYVDIFLAEKPEIYRTDFERTAEGFLNMDVDIIQEIYKNKLKFSERVIGIYKWGNIYNIISVKTFFHEKGRQTFTSRTTDKDKFIQLYRKKVFEKLLDE